MNEVLQERLHKQQQTHLYRQRKFSANRTISFSSNNYLGLAHHPDVINAFKNAADDYGVGSGASPLLGGYHPTHQALEETLAAFTGYPRAIIFSTGYMANLGVITTLLTQSNLVLQDRLNHASLIDAGKFSNAQLKRYLHCNVISLKKHLSASNNNTKLIVSDGVFSMDGDIAPLAELIDLTKKFNATLMIDDSHGLGVLGKFGGGVSEETHLKPDILVGSFGKAFGTFGAFVASNEIIIENLIQFARTYIYTTALPVPIAAATQISLKLITEESWRREKLSQLIRYFKQCAQQLDLKLLPSITPIQPLLINDAQKTLKIHQKLVENGILVGAVRPPTVSPNQSRLRITLNAIHTAEQVDRLLEMLKKFI